MTAKDLKKAYEELRAAFKETNRLCVLHDADLHDENIEAAYDAAQLAEWDKEQEVLDIMQELLGIRRKTASAMLHRTTKELEALLAWVA